MRSAAPIDAFAAAFELDDAQRAAADLLASPSPLGVYLWGPVGRGKTWLLDRYFEAATERKKRVHFHRFFRDLHASYFRHGFSTERALDELLGEIDLLCFDEFHVHDVGDGRLISRMLDAVFARGIVLVATSNYPPDGLLPNPLFHHTFVPAIELLKSKTTVVHVNGSVDYRTSGGSTTRFASGSWNVGPSGQGRTFAELCESPRSTGDYLAMIDGVEELQITGIPALKDADRDAVQRFSNLVDVLHDADVRTSFHAKVPLADFAVGCTGIDIERILSRLNETTGPEQ